jgi:hypothetical protein
MDDKPLVFIVKPAPCVNIATFDKWLKRMNKLIDDMSMDEYHEATAALHDAELRRMNNNKPFKSCVLDVISPNPKIKPINTNGMALIRSFAEMNKGLYLKQLQDFLLKKALEK